MEFMKGESLKGSHDIQLSPLFFQVQRLRLGAAEWLVPRGAQQGWEDAPPGRGSAEELECVLGWCLTRQATS